MKKLLLATLVLMTSVSTLAVTKYRCYYALTQEWSTTNSKHEYDYKEVKLLLEEKETGLKADVIPLNEKVETILNEMKTGKSSICLKGRIQTVDGTNGKIENFYAYDAYKPNSVQVFQYHLGYDLPLTYEEVLKNREDSRKN